MIQDWDSTFFFHPKSTWATHWTSVLQQGITHVRFDSNCYNCPNSGKVVYSFLHILIFSLLKCEDVLQAWGRDVYNPNFPPCEHISIDRSVLIPGVAQPVGQSCSNNQQKGRGQGRMQHCNIPYMNHTGWMPCCMVVCWRICRLTLAEQLCSIYAEASAIKTASIVNSWFLLRKLPVEFKFVFCFSIPEIHICVLHLCTCLWIAQMGLYMGEWITLVIKLFHGCKENPWSHTESLLFHLAFVLLNMGFLTCPSL